MNGAARVGQLVIDLSADVAGLKTGMAESVRVTQNAAQKMSAEAATMRAGFESVMAPLQSMTIKIGSLESQMKSAQSAATSLAKGLILGAAAGMSIDAIKNKILGVVGSMAHLKDLSEQTGASVANLSKLSGPAKQAGSDIDAISGALAKMSRGMVGADDETKGAGRALSFLGVSAKDAAGNLKDPAVMFVEISKKLDTYKDGAGKAAIAMTLFGKSGAELLPTMKLVAEQGETAAKVTDEQAVAARQYTRDLAKLDAQKGMVFKTLTTALLPTMSDFAGAMLDAAKNTNVANAAVKDMAKDNGVTEWADSAAMGVARLVDVIIMIPKLMSAVSGSFKAVGADINVISKSAALANPIMLAKAIGKGEDPFADREKAIAERNAVLADANKAWSNLWNYDGAAMEKAMAARIANRAKNAAAVNAAAAASVAADGAKPVLNFTPTDPDEDKAKKAAIEKEATAYAGLTAAISAKNAEFKLELATEADATEVDKLRIKFDEDIKAGKVKLTDEHQRAVRALLDEAAANEALTKAKQGEKEGMAWMRQSAQVRNASTAALEVEYEMYGKTTDARDIAMVAVKGEADLERFLTEERKKGISIGSELEAQLRAEKDMRIEVEQATLAQTKALGYASQLAAENKKFAAESIMDEKSRAMALLQIDADVWQERIRLAGDGTEAQKRLQEEYDTWYANQIAKPQIDEQKKIWQSVEQTAHDTFISIFDSGKSAFDRLRDTLKNGLLDLLYQVTIKKWVINIGTSVGVGGSAGMAQAAGLGSTEGGSGMSSLIGAAQTANSMYKMVSGGMTDSAGSAIAGMGNLFGSSSTSAFGAGFAGNTAGMNMTASEMFSSMGMTSEASAASLGASAGAAAGVLGGIAGGIYGGRMISGGYGSNGAVNTGTAIGAVVGSIVPVIGTALGALVGGLLGGAYNRMFGHKAPEVESQGLRGTFSGDTLTGSSYQNIIEKGGWFASDKRYTESQALSGDLLKQFSQGFTDLEKVSIGFAKSLGVSADALKDYSKDFDIKTTGDAAKDKQAITDFFTGVSEEIARKLVPNLDDFSKSGETASATLQRLADDFQSTNQIAQLLGKSGADVFGSLGMDSAAARERVIDLAGGVSTLAQQAQAYAQNYLTDAQRLAPVQKALDAAMASLGRSSVKTRDQFKAVIDGLDLTTEAGAKDFAALMALSDAFAQVHPAAEAAADAAAKVAATMKEAASGLLGDVDNSFSVLQTVTKRTTDALSKRIEQEKALSDAIQSTLDSIDPAGFEAMDRKSAQAQIQAAIAIAKAGGPLPAADDLKKALSVLSKDASTQFTTYQAYLKDALTTKNALKELGGLADDSLSVDQKQLNSLNDMLDAAQRQIDILKGIDSTGLSIADALNAFKLAVEGAKSNPIVAATPAISSAYQSNLGRVADSAGLQYWQNQAAAGVSISDIQAGIANSSEAQIQKAYKDLLGRSADAGGLNYWLKSGASIDAVKAALMQSDEYKLHKSIPGFASGGVFGGGWRIVGENGPELEATGPARIFNANQTSDLFARLSSPSSNNDVLASRLDKLCAAVERLEQSNSAENRAIARNTQRSADTWERATLGGNGPLLVEVAS